MDKPKYEYLDVVELMLKNFREDKPLLEGAVLFKGSRFTDLGTQAGGMHAYLLPQVAASYTHGWGQNDTFINTYPVDRDSTRFYPAARLADHLRGQEVTSYSVKDVERAIRPQIENLSYLAGEGGHRGFVNQIAALERFIKASFYEAGVPSRAQDSNPTLPQERFYYSGGPKVEKIEEVLSKLDRVTPANAHRAKESFAREQPSEPATKIAKLAVQHPESMKAFRALHAAAKSDMQQVIMAKYGDKPLPEFLAAAQAAPASDNQLRLLRLAQGLSANLQSNDQATRGRALAITTQLGQLNPVTTTVADVSKAVERINQASAQTSGGPKASPAPSRGTSPKAQAPLAMGRSLAR